jgi:hypothetical protein
MFNRFIPLAVLVGVFVVCLFTLGSGSLVGFVGMAAFLGGIFLLAHPNLVILAAVTLYFSHISPWFLPAALTASNAFMAIHVVMVFAAVFMGKRPVLSKAASTRLAYLYAALLVVLMAVRGSGLRILGSNTWGGTHYIAQFAVIGFFILVSNTRLSPRHWKTVVPAMALLSGARPVADILFFVSGGSISRQYMLVKAETGGLKLGMAALSSPAGYAGDVFRVHSASQFGIMAVLAALYLYSSRRVRWPTAIVIGLVGAGICGIAGYRANLIMLTLLLVVFVVTGRRPDRIPRLFGLGMAGGVLYALLIVMSPRMPGPAQRMVSVLPGAEVSHAVDIAGRSTVEWRLELWRRAAKDIPENFWIGKGLVFKRSEHELLRAMTGARVDNYDHQIWSRTYHNGPLAFLLDLGFPGALICTLLMFAIVREGKRDMAEKWHDESLRAYHHVAFTYFLSSVVMFWLSFGDVRSIVGFLFMGSVLRGLRVADARAAEEAMRTETDSPRPADRQPAESGVADALSYERRP